MPNPATSDIDNAGLYTSINNAAPVNPGDTATKGYVDGTTYTMANAALDGSTFLQVNVTAGKLGIRLQNNQRVLLHDLADVTTGTATLGSPPSAGNTRMDAVVWNTGTNLLEVVAGAEYATGNTPLFPVVTIAQRVLELYVIPDTATTNADISPNTLFSILGASVKIKTNSVSAGSPYGVAAYAAYAGGATEWTANGILTSVRYFAYLGSGAGMSIVAYSYSSSNVLNGLWTPSMVIGSGGFPSILYNNATSGLFANLLNDAIDELAASAAGIYKYTITGADFAGAPPGDSTYTLPSPIFSIGAGEMIMGIKGYLNSPVTFTALGTSAIITTEFLASAGTVTGPGQELSIGQGLDANPAGFKGFATARSNAFGEPFISEASPTDVNATFTVNSTFADVADYGSYTVWIFTQKLP